MVEVPLLTLGGFTFLYVSVFILFSVCVLFFCVVCVFVRQAHERAEQARRELSTESAPPHIKTIQCFVQPHLGALCEALVRPSLCEALVRSIGALR